MKIKVINVFKLTKPSKNILDVEIIEGNLSKDSSYVNFEENLEFKIESIGHVNPSIANYYPLIVTTNNEDLLLYKDKIFVKD